MSHIKRFLRNFTNHPKLTKISRSERRNVNKLKIEIEIDHSWAEFLFSPTLIFDNLRKTLFFANINFREFKKNTFFRVY